MKNLNFIIIIVFITIFKVNAQNQLPIENGEFETTNGSDFTQWTNQANNGGTANYSIETNNLISGSTKALKSEIIALGTNNYDVSTKSDYGFQIIAGETYTVSFYSKIEGAASSQIKLVFQSEVGASFQSKDLTVTDQWQQITHTFTAPVSANENKVKFWYLEAGVTCFIDMVSIVPGNLVAFDMDITQQTIEGFGAGIKRRTEDLYELNPTMRQQIEAYCFQDLEVNMIRFFVYHDLEHANDNNDPFSLDETQLDWTRYDSDASNWRSKYIGEALNNAFRLSVNGFDQVIGNCNSAPGWLKTNGQHNNGGTLISGGEDEYSEFLVAFLKGMKSRYNIDVTAISPTNEPDYEVTYESMNTTPSELSSIITNLDARLTSESLGNVKIISPECFTVESANSSYSAINYINSMFVNPAVVSAVDVVATHTYGDSNHNADWATLKAAGNNKPVWVTESANLNDSDITMTDAANYIKWMLRSFNEGGLTAFMAHLFYEGEKENGDSSALVVWTDQGDIILPKRYHSFKHFANLVKKGYQLIDSQVVQGGIMVGAFKSPDESKVVLQIFNEGTNQNMSVYVPDDTTTITHYITSDTNGEDFSIVNDLAFTLGDKFTTVNVPSMSLHSLVYNIDTALGVSEFENLNRNNIFKLFPNPTKDYITVDFNLVSNYQLSIYQLNGSKVFETKALNAKTHKLNINAFAKGLYLIKVNSENNDLNTTLKFIKN